MPRHLVPLVGPSSTARSITQNPERTVNFYLEMSQGNPRVPVSLIGAPGITSVAEFDYVIRGRYELDGRLFIVAGVGIYEVFSDNSTNLLTSLSSSSGYVHISDNAGKLILGDGTGFFVLDLDTNTTTQVSADGDPLLGTYSAFVDGYTLYLQRDSGRFYFSSLNDPETVEGLGFEEAEGEPDEAVNMVAINREVILIGTKTTEYFSPSGDADIPFARIDGGFIESGCSEPRSVVEVGGTVCWIGEDDNGFGVVFRLNGYRGERISTNAVEKAIAAETGEIVCEAYQEEGHTFYLVNLTATTWVFDLTTGQWAERAWTNPGTGLFERQRQQMHVRCFGNHYFTDFEDGRLYVQSLDTYDDDGDPKVSLRRFQGHNEPGKALRRKRLEIIMQTGVGLDGSGQGAAPVLMLRYSDDAGQKWSQEVTKSIGAIGDTDAECVFDRLGRARQRVYEAKISDPVRRYLVAAYEDVS